MVMCRYMAMWKKNQHLWKFDAPRIIETLKDKAPSHAKFEDKLSQYHRAAARILNEARDVDIDFVRIDTRPLARAVYKEAVELNHAVVTAMRELDLVSLAEEKEKIEHLRAGINKEPDTLEALKEVLGAINTVRTLAPDMELRYIDLHERFRTRLQVAKPEVLEDLKLEWVDAGTMQQLWDALVEEAAVMDNSLEEVKVEFSEITRKQVCNISCYFSEVLSFLKLFDSKICSFLHKLFYTVF